ncbi:amidohydrolase family protein [Kineococcus gynurae]|uniref:Amidohydrolase family protein n=1 Tax=Kineococcus gynurae TaxID=452979 RepID=A0ABV5LQJ5_9ACTN
MQRVFDAHLHVVDHRFPLTDNDGFRPVEFRVADYHRSVADLAEAGFVVVGGAVVSGSFQGFDQTYLRDGLRRFGPGFVGVTQVPADVTDTELGDLAADGVRGIRFNLRRGGSAGREELETLARRAFDVAGLHAELYVDSRELSGLAPVLRRLPAVSIDHLGLSDAGLDDLLRLVEDGVRVKATGFGRVDLDVTATVRAILAVDPGALLAGTDLPSTRARRPFRAADLQLLADVADEHRAAVLHDNAAAFYRVG